MLSARIGPEIDWFRKRFARQLGGGGAGDGIVPIDMATAENWLIREDLLGLIQEAASAVDQKDLSYGGGLGGSSSLLKAAAGFYNHFFSPANLIQPEHIVTGPGASGLLDTLLYCICDAGDAVLVEAPYWGSFEIYCTLRNHVRLIPVYPPTEPDDCISAFRATMRDAGCKVRGLLSCNPQNPRAQVDSANKISSLLRFCEKEDLHFISDEVYALTTFGAAGSNDTVDTTVPVAATKSSFVSAAKMDLQALQVNPARVHLLHSTSKDLGSSGLRMGFIVTQANPALRFALAILNHNKVSNITSAVTEKLLSDIPRIQEILDRNITRLRESSKVVTDFLEARNIAFLPPIAGVYVWTRIGGPDCTWEREAFLTQKCAEAGVAIGNGTDYTEAQAGWFRITFALPQSDLEEGMSRLARVLDEYA